MYNIRLCWFMTIIPELLRQRHPDLWSLPANQSNLFGEFEFKEDPLKNLQ